MCTDTHTVSFGLSISWRYRVCLVEWVSMFDKNEVVEDRSGFCAYEKEVLERSFGVFPRGNSAAIIILSLETWH